MVDGRWGNALWVLWVLCVLQNTVLLLPLRPGGEEMDLGVACLWGSPSSCEGIWCLLQVLLAWSIGYSGFFPF